MTRALALCAAAVATLALAASGSAAPRFQVLLLAPTHTPVATAPWPYAVVVTSAAGRLVPAKLHLQITFGGLAVGQVGRHATPGFWAETLEWPRSAIGQRVGLEVDVAAAGGTKRLNYAITTKTGRVPTPRRVVAGGPGTRVAAAVVNVRGPRTVKLAATGANRGVRYSVTCNRLRGSGVDVTAGTAPARKTLTVPGRHGDCAVGAVALGSGRVTVSLR